MSDWIGIIIFMGFIAIIVAAPASCSYVRATSQAERVCIEARAKKLDLEECKEVMADREMLKGITVK